MKRVPFRDFTPEEHQTWTMLFENQAVKRAEQIHPIFDRGIDLLGLAADRVPDIDRVNEKLSKAAGFEGVPVEGLEEDESFYRMLAERKFPIGNFIRERRDLSYTPAPDVFHDLYGHLPFLADRDYADFCAELGKKASRFADRPEALQQYARLFWFAIEFSVIRTNEGRRIFGAGIASSIGECEYALSDRPEILPFDVERIRLQDFKIDEFQKRIFLIDELRDLYGCLDEFDRRVAASLS